MVEYIVTGEALSQGQRKYPTLCTKGSEYKLLFCTLPTLIVGAPATSLSASPRDKIWTTKYTASLFKGKGSTDCIRQPKIGK